MLLNERLYTVEGFSELCQRPEYVDKHWELIEGVIYEVSPTFARHGYIAMYLGHKLLHYLEGNDLGTILGTDVGFRLTPKTLCSPDIAFVSYAHGDTRALNGYVETAPDIAVEVISDGNTPSEINHKTKLYIQHGTRLVWIIYPEQREIHVYRAEYNTQNQARVTYLGIEDTLSGEDVLPGFSLPLKALFPSEKQEA